ncbi:hypothetical protein D1641_04440 [Colidextribacter sp. OB.20]|uniref:permease prefix domain 1-containing protein n=1 Tax=Colidextribacter sp. OB.20 TaxID=2304568 RepID=UPI001370A92C|nr:permease prefix domain 1-containing protein [Colidextribacter sp. OB.20]NBI09267.1 hypothetical protein [Colidextribacter sp. OB.20]
MKNNLSVLKWLDIAVSGIRFGPDRAEVRQELLEHLEDKAADLARVFPDIPEKEAQERALSAMGDPEELKTSLAKVHKPWLGYLWTASQVLAIAAVLLAVVLCGVGALVDRYGIISPEGAVVIPGGYMEDCYQSGVDPWRADGPYPREGGALRSCVAVLHPRDSARAAGYRFRVARAGLFHFQDSLQDPGSWTLFCDLRAAGLPWEPAADEALRWVRGVDSAGREYPGYYPEEQDYLVTVNTGHGCLLERDYDLTVIRIPPGTEWIRLEYDHEGVQWSLTIPLEEGDQDG